VVAILAAPPVDVNSTVSGSARSSRRSERASIPALHPHAFWHACAVELLRRPKNLRAVQEYFLHEDAQTTTGYTRISQQVVHQASERFDNDGK
jgi:site-specific recombinase XerD